MKKFLLSALLTLVLVSTASAADFKILSFGVKAGYNASSVAGLGDMAGPMRSNFMGGAFFEFRPIKWVGLSIEALYTGSGFQTAEITDREITGPVTIVGEYGFIDIPVMARIYLAGGLSLNVGVQASYVLDPKLSMADMSASLDINKAVFSIPIGLSYSFDFGLIVEARYTMGITELFPSVTEHNTHADDYYDGTQSYGIALSVGWRF